MHSSSPSSSSSTASLQSESNEALGVKIYILQAKLDDNTIEDLYQLIEKEKGSKFLSMQLCSSASNADVIVSNVRMRKRLERHIQWDIARRKAIVTPDWVRQSIEQRHLLPCGDYAALKELHDETAEHCPDCNQACCDCLSGPKSSSPQMFATGRILASERLLSNYAARFACLRASPLFCPNQALIRELYVLNKHRELEGKNINALAYERAIATIKAYPYPITSANLESEVLGLPHLGEKVQSKIREFVKQGAINECETLKVSERYLSLKLFTTIHGVGATTARTLYSIGLRTMDDMDQYYDVMAGDEVTPNGLRRDGLPELNIKAALLLRNELQTAIPREEVENMRDVIMAELEAIRPGCVSIIVGGYRRGKAESSDVDIVISHPNLVSRSDHVKNLSKQLLQRLYNRGMVTHATHLSGFHNAYNPLRTSNWDSLEKALTIFKLPPCGKEKTLHRRVDLIFAARESYWTAVVGWTGSKMFERDLRLWAKERGMKFDSSAISRRHDSMLYHPKSEKEVFDLLGLEYIEPTLRNANL